MGHSLIQSVSDRALCNLPPNQPTNSSRNRGSGAGVGHHRTLGKTPVSQIPSITDHTRRNQPETLLSSDST
jgi:hypothetical protein